MLAAHKATGGASSALHATLGFGIRFDLCRVIVERRLHSAVMLLPQKINNAKTPRDFDAKMQPLVARAWDS